MVVLAGVEPANRLAENEVFCQLNYRTIGTDDGSRTRNGHLERVLS